MLIWGSPPDKKKTGVARIYYVYTFWSFKPPNHKKYQKSELSLPSLLYFWKAEGPQWEFKDVKYDIPCVNSIQLVPTMEKKDLYVIIFGEISENEVHKSYCHKPIFMWQ